MKEIAGSLCIHHTTQPLYQGFRKKQSWRVTRCQKMKGRRFNSLRGPLTFFRLQSHDYFYFVYVHNARAVIYSLRAGSPRWLFVHCTFTSKIALGLIFKKVSSRNIVIGKNFILAGIRTQDSLVYTYLLAPPQCSEHYLVLDPDQVRRMTHLVDR